MMKRFQQSFPWMLTAAVAAVWSLSAPAASIQEMVERGTTSVTQPGTAAARREAAPIFSPLFAKPSRTSADRASKWLGWRTTCCHGVWRTAVWVNCRRWRWPRRPKAGRF